MGEMFAGILDLSLFPEVWFLENFQNKTVKSLLESIQPCPQRAVFNLWLNIKQSTSGPILMHKSQSNHGSGIAADATTLHLGNHIQFKVRSSKS